MFASRYCVYRISQETGAQKELPLVTVFTAAEVLEVMRNMFTGKEFETDNGSLESQVLSPHFAREDELLTMSDPNNTAVLDTFIVKRKS